MLLDSIRF